MIDFTGLEKLKAPESAQNAPEQPQTPKAYNTTLPGSITRHRGAQRANV